jgi:hypothetical protein
MRESWIVVGTEGCEEIWGKSVGVLLARTDLKDIRLLRQQRGHQSDGKDRWGKKNWVDVVGFCPLTWVCFEICYARCD